MVLSLAAAWTIAMEQDGVPVVYLVDMELGPMAYTTVNSFATGAGDTLTITVNAGVPLVLTEGSNFSAGASNTECATNMAAAINASILQNSIFAASRNQTVTIIPITTSVTSIVTATSDAVAWSITPSALEKTLYFASGQTQISGYTMSVAEVSPFASSMDVITREVKVGDVEITFQDDGALRDVLVRSRPKGKKVTIKIGTPSLSTSDYAPYGVFVIDEVVPAPGVIAVRCVEAISYALDAEIVGEFCCIHPLAAIRRCLVNANVPTGFYNDTSLESTEAQYEDISHWAVSRHNNPAHDLALVGLGINTGMTTPTKAKDVIDDLARMMNAALRANEEGLYSIVRYDSAASVTRHIGVDEAEFEPVSSYENFCNKVSVTGVSDPNAPNPSIGSTAGVVIGGGDSAANFQTPIYVAEDEISTRMQAISGGARDFSITLPSDWLGMYGILSGTLAADVSDLSVDVLYPCINGFCGTRPDSTDTYSNFIIGVHTFTQRTEDTLTSDRTAFLLITDGVNSEIVECESFAVTDRNINAVLSSVYTEPALTPVTQEISYPLTSGTVFNYPRLGTFTVKSGGRGSKGTTVQAWDGSAIPLFSVRVFDITIPVAMAESRLARASNGIPIANLRTSLRHYALQLGDAITCDSDLYVNFRKDGADANTVWEIVAKEVQILEDSSAVVFTLAWMRDDVEFISSPVYSGITPPIVYTPTFDDVLTDDFDIPLTTDGGETLYRG